jgi:RNA polymerase sigma-70 factor (ECF subfamily)
MADAEDVAQAVFLRLAASGSTIDNPGSYLYRAAINGALDLIRKRAGKGEVDLEFASGVSGSAPECSPERQCSNRELQARLRKAVAELSPRSAEMFVLRYIEDRDLGEIAEIMGTSRAVVAVTLHTARTKLKKQFESYKRGQ